MKFFVTGVPEIRKKVEMIAKAVVQPPDIVDISQREFVAIRSPRGTTMEIRTDEKFVYVRCGIGSEMLEFNHYAKDEERFLSAVQSFVRGILSEEYVSVAYRQLFSRVDGIVPLSEYADYQPQKGFQCTSWRGTYDYPKR